MHNELDKVAPGHAAVAPHLAHHQQNIGLSFAYNAIMVPLAMMAKVNPLVAAITMPISSLIVIGNAARIHTCLKMKNYRGRMDVIYSLIPGMMLFGLLSFAVLIWAVKKGQYEDMEGNASRILLDDDDDMLMDTPNSANPKRLRMAIPRSLFEYLAVSQ